MKNIFVISILILPGISGCQSFQSHEELKAPCTDDKVASLTIDCDKRLPVNVAVLLVQ